MNEGIRISLINSRGRIIWTDKRDLQSMLKEIEEDGLPKFHIFPNPKELYYPQWDRFLNKNKNTPPVVMEGQEEKLEVIVV